MSKYNVEKKEYVKLLDRALEPLTDFGSIRYLNEHSTGAEYIMLTDAMGSATFLDVTSFDQERILLEVITVCAGNETKAVIRDKAKRRAIATLFSGKGNH